MRCLGSFLPEITFSIVEWWGPGDRTRSRRSTYTGKTTVEGCVGRTVGPRFCKLVDLTFTSVGRNPLGHTRCGPDSRGSRDRSRKKKKERNKMRCQKTVIRVCSNCVEVRCGRMVRRKGPVKSPSRKTRSSPPGGRERGRGNRVGVD